MVPLGVRQLECFIAVAEEGHVGRAAARLHMTQPPLTRRISRLEREVGATLFRRTPTGVELTAAGSVLLERGYRILQLAEHAVERTKLAEVGYDGSLVVGYTGATVLEVVPTVLGGFLARHPNVSLTIDEVGKLDQFEAILDGRMHLGFGGRYHAQPGIAVREILREPLEVAVPSGHHLAGRAGVELTELATEDLVLFPAASRPSFVDEVIAMFSGAGIVVRPARLADKVTDALVYVATTAVCAVVPRSATRIDMPGVSFVPLVGAPSLALDCVYQADDPPAVVREFVAHLDRQPVAANA